MAALVWDVRCARSVREVELGSALMRYQTGNI
jgi:hypothetical protein